MAEEVDALVVGAGPAGLTAAIQLVRRGIRTVVLEKDLPGGQLRTAGLLENYPGFAFETGARAAAEIVSHARKLGVRILKQEARSVEGHGPFIVATGAGTWKARAVILATGARPRELGGGSLTELPGERSLRGKRVVVIGGGDAAFDRALSASKVAGSVTVLVRGRPAALPLLVRRCRRLGVKLVLGAGEAVPRRTGGRLEVDAARGSWPADIVLACIGKEPGGDLLPAPLGELGPHPLTGATFMRGLFVIGDAAGGARYLGIAVGMGTAAGNRAADMLGPSRPGRAPRARGGR